MTDKSPVTYKFRYDVVLLLLTAINDVALCAANAAIDLHDAKTVLSVLSCIDTTEDSFSDCDGKSLKPQAT